MSGDPTWVQWATLASSIAGVVTAGAGIVAFSFLRRQQKQVERQIVGTTSRYMYEEMSRILCLLVERPELRPYVYDGKSIDPGLDALEKQRVLATAGLFADFFEQLLYQSAFGNLSTAEYTSTWMRFSSTVLRQSPVIRRYVLDNPTFYSDDFVAFVRTTTDGEP